MSTNSSTMLWGRAFKRGLPCVIILISMVLGYRAVLPPAPLPDSTALDQFSAERASAHVEIIAANPHPMGSASIEEVRAYITSELEPLG